MKILVVDDEQDICEILKFNLEMEGYEVATANSAEEALERFFSSSSSEYPSLILLDVMMGEMSGFQMARRLKENEATAHIPIIFTTALDDEDNTVKGLNIGADDYIAKPLSMKEVKARVKAVLRRTAGSAGTADNVNGNIPAKDREDSAAKVLNAEEEQGEVIRYEGLEINQESKMVIADGKEVALTKIEFELLTLLVRKAGKVFSREELLKRCWPSDTYVLDRTVDVNITRLRKKTGQYGKRIKTRFGYGYTFEK